MGWLARTLHSVSRMIIHLTAHAILGLAPLDCFAAATLLWRRLQVTFALALSCALMPTHLHLLTAVDDPENARRRLRAVLSGVARSTPINRDGPTWMAVPKPEIIRDELHLRRMVRYVALNPCRVHLARDPLSWLWSTHRDIFGAAAHAWVPPDRLAAALGLRRDGFARAHHAYVSGDPTTQVAGTPPVPSRPPAARPDAGPTALLGTLIAAASAALRVHPSTVVRRTPARHLFVALAWRQGWRDARLVGQHCGLEPEAVHRLASVPCPALSLDAGLVCLADARLRQNLTDGPGARLGCGTGRR
jgi:hypothetical protein